MGNWPFADPPNTASITVRAVLEGAWIAYVSHDADDGGWQFHGEGPSAVEDSVVVGLGCMVGLDPSIAELSDLPLGWQAWRDAPGALWHREVNPRWEEG